MKIWPTVFICYDDLKEQSNLTLIRMFPRCPSSCPFRPRPETGEGQDPGGHADLEDEDAGVEGPRRDAGRRQDHRDRRSRALRHMRLHQEQDGALHTEGKVFSVVRHLLGNGK